MKKITSPLPPGSTVGILGGGQLARMLALAAGRLGLDCHIYAPEADSPAFAVSAAKTVAAYDDFTALEAFAKAVDVVTYEFENVPGDTAGFLDALVPVAPGVAALKTAQDRIAEKTFITGLSIPVAPFAEVSDLASLEAALARIGRPAVLKTRRFGYDGKGQTKIHDGTDPAAAFAEIGRQPAVLEGFVSFEKEISVIAARSWSGEVRVYDVPENHHENHILKTSTVPARISPAVASTAMDFGSRIIAALDYVGVIGVEMFVAGDSVIVNEIAPRVHNSGHWTMDACAVSQFEQHIRAVCGWPLGAPERYADVVMTNLLGDEANRWQELAAEPRVHVHLYGKRESRPGRKMGHFNRITPRQA
ncbi:MAG: 5-(carboxyamino)imidazole ribonucleotide synthase [Aestuariivirga sp.]|uniref:5-(carboxyamino)imidazole ribonucleotide synthase n=1 Tax=Aestuariivirga sp. TaxID=2650926 RepID=UPI003017FCA9